MPLPAPILANRPILREVVNQVLDAIETARERRQNAGLPGQPDNHDVVEELAQNPVAVNNLNAEPAINSRTAGGGVIGGGGVLLLVINILQAGITGEPLVIDPDLAVGILMGLLGPVVTLVGRLKSNLGPVQWLKPWTWFR